jgi:hypothetical protein
MEGDVVRRVTISATGQGIDETAASVKNLGDTFSDVKAKADGGLSFTAVAASIAGIGAAAVAAMAALKGFVNLVGEQSKSLADMGEAAERASMSTAEYQKTLYAAMSAGVKEKDFTSGFEAIQQSILKASQGSTEFGRLLKANGMDIRDNITGEVKTANVVLGDLMKLMRNAAPDVQQRIASIAGVSKDWVPFLRQASDEFEAQKRKAADLGIIIDDSVIEKAKDFEKQWHTAVAGWDLQFKAALASILPLLIKAADLATTIINSVGAVSSTLSGWMTPDESKTRPQLDQKINDAQRLAEMLERLNGDMSSLDGGPFSSAARARNLAGMLGLPENASLEDVFKLIDKLTALFDKPPRVNIPTDKDYSTKLPGNDDGANALTRTEDQMQRRIAVMQADADAVGKSAGAHAGLRAEMELTAAAERAGIEVTDDLKERFLAYGVAIEDVGNAMEKAKIASEISRGNQLMFASPEDVKIANQLKGLYGDDITKALASSEAAAIRFQDSLKSIVDLTKNLAGAFANDFVSGIMAGKSAMESLTSAANSLGKSLTKAGIDNIIKDPTSATGYIEAGIGLVTQLFTDDGDKAARAAREKAEQQYADSLTRRAQYNDDAKLAGIDQSTLQGQLQAFDIRAAQMRQDEVANGNYAIVELEHKLAAEREAIVKKSNEQIAKTLNDFLNSIKTGPLSVLSPEEQLKFLQGQFSSDLAKAQGGDTDAINNLTKDASSLLDAAKSYYGSSGGYVDTYNAVTSAISGLASGNLIQAAPDAGAYSTAGDTPYGDLSYLKPSVSTTSSSFTPPTSVTRTAPVVASSGTDDVAGVIAQGFNGSTQAIVDAINGLGDRIKRVEEATKQGQVRRRLPGSMAA